MLFCPSIVFKSLQREDELFLLQYPNLWLSFRKKCKMRLQSFDSAGIEFWIKTKDDPKVCDIRTTPVLHAFSTGPFPGYISKSLNTLHRQYWGKILFLIWIKCDSIDGALVESAVQNLPLVRRWEFCICLQKSFSSKASSGNLERWFWNFLSSRNVLC